MQVIALILPEWLPIPAKQWLVARFPAAAAKYRVLRAWVLDRAASN